MGFITVYSICDGSIKEVDDDNDNDGDDDGGVHCRKKDSDDLVSGDHFQVISGELGNTKLVVQNVQLSDAGVYFCVAENEKGKVKCAATLRVNRQWLFLFKN